ncbi:MAG TPA: pantoate--beta-alanine ligase [Caulobacterales bacterium]|nr:pantoate--beta-alanine ligase [Caulobacterales bacterium]
MSDSLPVARDVAALREATRGWRAQGLSIGFVPTMGALHAGHVSLVRAAKSRLDKVVTSIFVNPKQFAPHEDFERYPRDEAGDASKLAEGGCDLIYAPAPAIMYPEGFSSRVIVSRVATPLEGEMRPHFFAGVATVVTKLFLQCLPDAAFFGEKDYQQLQVVKRLVRDLDIPVEIVGCPTVREPDGLAMSSRNAYLSPRERSVAAKLNVILRDCIEALKHGVDIVAVERAGALQLHEAGFECIDYVAVRDADTLEPVEALDRPVRILAAAWLGKTRLIDNMAV